MPLVVVLTLLAACAPSAFAQVRRVALAVGEARVLEVRGAVQLFSQLQGVSTPSGLLPGAVVGSGDRLHSAADGYAVLELLDGSTIELQPETDLELLDFKGGVRDLFRIWLGRVRLKVRKLIGAPNPYQMHSPIATIGVRGTEFEIEVQSNQVTTVRVFEGLVAVRNTQLRDDEVLVGPGREVTVYPLRPPDPPVSFEQVVAENFNRETILEHPLTERFMAFPDPHLDLVDNPAYAAQVQKASGRFYLYPVRSQALATADVPLLSPLGRFVDLDELFATDERRLQGFSSRLSYVFPTQGWTLGGIYEYRGLDQDFRYRISRKLPSAFGGEIAVQQVGQSRFAPDLASDSGSHRAVLLAARRFPGKGLAFSYDWSHQGGGIESLYEFLPQGMLLSSEEATTGFRSDHRRLTFGYHMESDRIGSLGLLYRFGFLSGDTIQSRHEINQKPADLARFGSSGHSQEASARWRKRLQRNLFFALKGSLAHTAVGESIQDFRIPDSYQKSSFWIPSGAASLGFIWRERLFAAFDYKYSNIRWSSSRDDLELGSLVEMERTIRRNHSVHAWAQYQLPWGFFAGGGVTSFWGSETLRALYWEDSLGIRRDAQGRPQDSILNELTDVHLNQLGFNAGRRFRDWLFLEYELRQTQAPTYRPLSHSFLLRLSF